jgi:hypothetical protein
MDLGFGDHRLVINPKGRQLQLTMLLHHAEELDAVEISCVLSSGYRDVHDLGARPDEDLALAGLLGVVLIP